MIELANFPIMGGMTVFVTSGTPHPLRSAHSYWRPRSFRGRPHNQHLTRAAESKTGGIQGIAQAAIRPVGETPSRATRPARTNAPSVRCPPSNPH